jgi:hypothetical protein
MECSSIYTDFPVNQMMLPAASSGVSLEIIFHSPQAAGN